MVVLLDDELPVFELFPLFVGAAEFAPPLFALPELDCAFPTGLSLPLLPGDELFAFELLALPLFELLAPFPAVVDELLSVGVVVLEPPLLEPLLDGELLVFSLLDAGEAELPLPDVD